MFPFSFSTFCLDTKSRAKKSRRSECVCKAPGLLTFYRRNVSASGHCGFRILYHYPPTQFFVRFRYLMLTPRGGFLLFSFSTFCLDTKSRANKSRHSEGVCKAPGLRTLRALLPSLTIDKLMSQILGSSFSTDGRDLRND